MRWKNSFPWQRKHTLLFSEHAWTYRPVVLEAEIDMTQVIQHRQNSSTKISYLAYFIQALSKVLLEFPQANSILVGKLFPRLIPLESINAKFTLDKTLYGQRMVVSAIIPQANLLPIEQIQNNIDYFKSHKFETCPEFKPIQMLQKLPLPLGKLLFNYAMRKAKIKSKVQGSFTVTSLGGRNISRFVPLSGSTLTLGVADITAKTCIKDGQIIISDCTNLTLVFDHRVLDGAIAAEILSKLKHDLETSRFTPMQ